MFKLGVFGMKGQGDESQKSPGLILGLAKGQEMAYAFFDCLHMAGAETAQAMTREEIRHLIREAGRDPVERDTLYNQIGSPPEEMASFMRLGMAMS